MEHPAPGGETPSEELAEAAGETAEAVESQAQEFENNETEPTNEPVSEPKPSEEDRVNEQSEE